MGNYQQSSREAYNLVKPNLSTARARVLEAIRTLGTCSDKQISNYLNWPINRVTPRRLELESAGLIYSPKKEKNENGISVLMWAEPTNTPKEAA